MAWLKDKILAMLRNAEDYVSGQEMCNHLGVSRTAVWKTMNQLKEEGYEIEAVSNKGYCLRVCPDVVTDYEIKSRLKVGGFLKEVYSFDTIDSTNSYAKKVAMSEEDVPFLVIADSQQAGRGRRGRSWSSKKGEGIFMSLVVKPSIPPEDAPKLTLLTALAITKALEKVAKVTPMIKWPNDLILGQKKVCGILTEMSSEMDYIHYVVIGMGINVHGQAFEDEVKDVATSLWLQGRKGLHRSDLVSAIVEAFETYYNQFISTKTLDAFVEEYNARLIHKEKQVRVQTKDGEREGIAHGIDAQGNLIVEFEDGTTEAIISGEVSVRGLYGYV